MGIFKRKCCIMRILQLFIIVLYVIHECRLYYCFIVEATKLSNSNEFVRNYYEAIDAHEHVEKSSHADSHDESGTLIQSKDSNNTKNVDNSNDLMEEEINTQFLKRNSSSGSSSTSTTHLHEPIKKETKLPFRSTDFESETGAHFDIKYFDHLPKTATSMIIDSVHQVTPGLRNLLLSSKKMKTIAETVGYGSYTRIGGTGDKIVEDIRVCKELNQESVKVGKNVYYRMEQIRELYVSWKVYATCGFSSEKLPNLKKLVLYLDSEEQTELEQGVEKFRNVFLAARLKNKPFQSLWKNDLIGSSMKTVKDPELTLEQKRAGYLLFYELLREYSHNVKVDIVTSKFSLNLIQSLLISPSDENRLQLVKNVLESNRTDIAWQDVLQNTPLHFCLLPDFIGVVKDLYFNTVDCINLLLKFKVNPNLQNMYGYSAVHIASALPHQDILSLLIQKGGDINAQNEKLLVQKSTQFYKMRGLAPIFVAIEFGVRGSFFWKSTDFINCTFLSLDCYRFQFPREDFDISFWETIFEQNKNLNKLPMNWLANQPDLNLFVLDVYQRSPLELASISQLEDLAIQMLRAKPVDQKLINQVSRLGGTPPFWAVKYDMVQLLRELINLGINVNIVSPLNFTLFDMNYIHRNSLAIYELLFQNGFNTNKVSAVTKRRFVFHIAQSSSLDLIKMALDYDVDFIHGEVTRSEFPALGTLLRNIHHRYDDIEYISMSPYARLMKAKLDDIIFIIIEKLSSIDQSGHELSALEYYKLLYIIFAHRIPLSHYMISDFVPEQILTSLQYPYFNSDQGLLFTQIFLSDPHQNLFENLTNTYPENTVLKCSVMLDTPLLKSYVEKVVRMSDKLFTDCQFDKSHLRLREIELDVVTNSLRLYPRKAMQFYKKMLPQVSKIVLHFPMREDWVYESKNQKLKTRLKTYFQNWKMKFDQLKN